MTEDIFAYSITPYLSGKLPFAFGIRILKSTYAFMQFVHFEVISLGGILVVIAPSY